MVDELSESSSFAQVSSLWSVESLVAAELVSDDEDEDEDAELSESFVSESELCLRLQKC